MKLRIFYFLTKKTEAMKTSKILFLVAAGITAGLLVSSCGVSIPKGATAVKPFKENRYLGKWYEIARLDMRFEKNLNNVTATYTASYDGTLKVENKGYDYKKNEWKEAIGKAKFVNSHDEGRLKVSFFGPFYAGYNVIAITDDYQQALVAGDNLKYLWILSRSTTIPESTKDKFLAEAKRIGYNTDNLIWVEHTKDN